MEMEDACYKLLTKTSNNQRLRSAGDNDRRSKRSSALLCVSFTWQMVKTRVIRLRVWSNYVLCIPCVVCSRMRKVNWHARWARARVFEVHRKWVREKYSKMKDVLHLLVLSEVLLYKILTWTRQLLQPAEVGRDCLWNFKLNWFITKLIA